MSEDTNKNINKQEDMDYSSEMIVAHRQVSIIDYPIAFSLPFLLNIGLYRLEHLDQQ